MIEYERLLEIAKKMHLWIFLNTSNEYKVYDELGLTDEENMILGSGIAAKDKIYFYKRDNELTKEK